jgi:hypothetical protein
MPSHSPGGFQGLPRESQTPGDRWGVEKARGIISRGWWQCPDGHAREQASSPRIFLIIFFLIIFSLVWPTGEEAKGPGGGDGQIIGSEVRLCRLSDKGPP